MSLLRVGKGWRDAANLPRELWILCIATFVNRLGAMALPFLALYLTRSMGFTAGWAGGVLALYGAAALAVGPWAGRLSDRWGPHRLIRASLVGSGVVLILFPFATSLPAILVMTVFWAAAVESFRPANLALVGELGAAHGRFAFSAMRFSSNLGMSIGPAVGGFLALVSFPALFIIDGLSALGAAAILGGAWMRPVPRAAAPRQKTRLLDAFRSDRSYRVFLLGIIPAAIVYGQFGSSMPLFIVRDLGLTEAAVGLLYSVNTVMIITMEIPINSATAHWRHGRSLALGSFLMAVGFGLLAPAANYLHVGLAVMVFTVGEMILYPAMSAYASDAAPEGRKGEYMGMYIMSLNFALRLVGPWVGVLVLDRLGARTLWGGMFAVGLLSVVVLGRLQSGRERE